MADTVDTGLLPRTYFKAPRVPFDFRALALAMFGYLIYWGGSLLLGQIFKGADPVRAFLATAYGLFEGLPFIDKVIGWFMGTVFGFGTELVPVEGHFWAKLVGGVWIFVVWSYFGQAIHRITSLRIARDEGLSFGQAFAFAAKNWITVLLAPVIIAVTMGFFYGCNALAGVIISIPWGGQVLALILVPLAMIATLLILLIGIGGVFGMPLIGAAAAWERNGTLDAISRAFSYIFARPLQFFWNYFLIFLFVGVILLVGGWFVTVLTKSIGAGTWSDELAMYVNPPANQTEVPGEFETAYTELAESTGFAGGRDSAGNPWVKHWDVVTKAMKHGFRHGLNALVFWVAINLIWVGVFGYAIYWFLGATTSVYADLRADVDGTEEDEIYLEEEEEDFDALAEAAGEAEAAAESAAEAPAGAGEGASSSAESTPDEAGNGEGEAKTGNDGDSSDSATT